MSQSRQRSQAPVEVATPAGAACKSALPAAGQLQRVGRRVRRSAGAVLLDGCKIRDLPAVIVLNPCVPRPMAQRGACNSHRLLDRAERCFQRGVRSGSIHYVQSVSHQGGPSFE
jgi:hypothetical protein